MNSVDTTYNGFSGKCQLPTQTAIPAEPVVMSSPSSTHKTRPDSDSEEAITSSNSKCENFSDSAKMDMVEVVDSNVNSDGHENQKTAHKRHHNQNDSDAPAKKKKKKKSPPPVVSPDDITGYALKKNSVCVLNEIRQGLEYKTESVTGPMHCPVFVITVDVDGQIFKGTGKSKKLAKQAAAEAVLNNFLTYHNEAARAKRSTDVDFSSDTIDPSMSSFSLPFSCETLAKKLTDLKNKLAEESADKDKATSTFAIEKSPVMILNDMKPGLKYECVSSDGDVFSKFTMSVTVDRQVFQGSGPSKRIAKAAAARSALSYLYDLNLSTNTGLGQDFQYPTRLTPKVPCNLMPSSRVDVFARLILNKYSELMENDPVHLKRKVLAGIVMTTGPECPGVVISLGTGTKCVSGEHMSISGAVINDCHAEIVARRGLCYFLYKQLTNITDPELRSDSVFEPRENGKGYTLKSNIAFHLFINTSPCGDARIFSPHEASEEVKMDKHPNRNSRGQLRTKIESGEGTIPVSSSDGIQTWDGVLQGQRLLTMSCSDKVARWNVVGVQGALLSHFIEPIYLESVTLGSLFHLSHMYRAICGRIEMTVQGLPPPFRLNKPSLGVTSSAEARHTGKAPNHSVNWVIGESDVEVVNAVTGKIDMIPHGSSRLCKRNLFRLFSKLLFAEASTITGLSKDTCPVEYGGVKMHSKEYNAAKVQLIEAFKKASLGLWLKKPFEQNYFELEVEEFQ